MGCVIRDPIECKLSLVSYVKVLDDKYEVTLSVDIDKMSYNQPLTMKVEYGNWRKQLHELSTHRLTSHKNQILLKVLASELTAYEILCEVYDECSFSICVKKKYLFIDKDKIRFEATINTYLFTHGKTLITRKK